MKRFGHDKCLAPRIPKSLSDQPTTTCDSLPDLRSAGARHVRPKRTETSAEAGSDEEASPVGGGGRAKVPAATRKPYNCGLCGQVRPSGNIAMNKAR